MTNVNAVGNILNAVRDIRELAEGQPGDDPAGNLERIRAQASDILMITESFPTLREQLVKLTAPRIHPINFDPYPGSTDDVAHEIAIFVNELDDGGIAHDLRALLIAKLTEAAEEWKRAERARKRLAVENIMAAVAAAHLYPALRAAGVENPETIWELRGRFDDDAE